MSKSILTIDTPSSCYNCPLCIELDRYRCAINKRWCGDEQGYFTSSTMPTWCPLKEEKKAIPIEWIEKWANKWTPDLSVSEMLKDWEKENDN